MIRTTQTAQRLSRLGYALIILGAASALYPLLIATEAAEGFAVLGMLVLFLGVYCRVAASRMG